MMRVEKFSLEITDAFKQSRARAELGHLSPLSQVILSFQLPFAIVPLVMFTASRAKMGELVAPRWLTVACGLIAALIVALNVNLLAGLALG